MPDPVVPTRPAAPATPPTPPDTTGGGPLYRAFLAQQARGADKLPDPASGGPLYQEYVRQQTQGLITAGPAQPVPGEAHVTAGPLTPVGVPSSEYARLASTGDLASRIQMNLALQSAPLELQRRVREIAGQMQAPGTAETAANLFAGNLVAPLSQAAAARATEHDLDAYAQGGGNAAAHANLFGAAGALGDVAGNLTIPAAAEAAVPEVAANASRLAKTLGAARRGAAIGGAMGAGGEAVFGNERGERTAKDILTAGAKGAATGGVLAGATGALGAFAGPTLPEGVALDQPKSYEVPALRLPQEPLFRGQTSRVDAGANSGQFPVDEGYPDHYRVDHGAGSGQFPVEERLTTPHTLQAILNEITRQGGQVLPEDREPLVEDGQAIHDRQAAPAQHVAAVRSLAQAHMEQPGRTLPLPPQQGPDAPGAFSRVDQGAGSGQFPVDEGLPGKLGQMPVPAEPGDATAALSHVLKTLGERGTPITPETLKQASNLVNATTKADLDPAKHVEVLNSIADMLSERPTQIEGRPRSETPPPEMPPQRVVTQPSDTRAQEPAVEPAKPATEPAFSLTPEEAPKGPEQPSMFGEMTGTKLQQTEAKKLRLKDQAISAEEMGQRRDELGAPKGTPEQADTRELPIKEPIEVALARVQKMAEAPPEEQAPPVAETEQVRAKVSKAQVNRQVKDLLERYGPERAQARAQAMLDSPSLTEPSSRAHWTAVMKALGGTPRETPPTPPETTPETPPEAPVASVRGKVRKMASRTAEALSASAPDAAPEVPPAEGKGSQFDSMRKPSGEIRRVPMARFTDDALHRELARLIEERQRDEEASQYTWVKDDDFHMTEDGRSVPLADKSQDRISRQAKAMQRMKQSKGVMDRIEAELKARHGDDYDVFAGMERTAERDAEREGLAQHDAGPVDESDPALEFRFSGPGITPAQRAAVKTVARRLFSDPHAHLQGTALPVGEALAADNYTPLYAREVQNQLETALESTRGPDHTQDPLERDRQFFALQRAAQHDAHAEERYYASDRLRDQSNQAEDALPDQRDALEEKLTKAAHQITDPEKRQAALDAIPGKVQKFVARQRTQIRAWRTQAAELQAEAERHQAFAGEARSSVPEGVEDSPEFKAYVQQYQTRVAPMLDDLYLRGGGSRESMVAGEHGYVPLISERRLQNAQIERAHRVFGRAEEDDGVGAGTKALSPLQGRLRRFFGQRESVIQASPKGLEAPMQGPVENEAGSSMGAGIVRGLSATRRVSGTYRATGEADAYSDNPREAIGLRAEEGARKAASNDLYRAVAGHGRLLEPGEKRWANKHYLSFTDSREIVQPKDDVYDRDGEYLRRTPIHTYEVTPEVKRAIEQHLARKAKVPSNNPALRRLQGASNVANEAVLANPLVAPYHFLREAGSSESVNSRGNLAQDALHSLPFVNAAVGARRAMKLDLNDPAVIRAEQKGARYGVLRVDETHGHGTVDWGHDKLFDPRGGWDRRVRLKMILDFDADREAKGLPTEGPAYGQALRHYVTQSTGEYTKGNRGDAMQAIQHVAPFAPIHGAILKTGANTALGRSGLTDATPAQRAGTLLRGTLGKTLGAGVATAAAAGHFSTNGSLGLPLYHTPHGIRFFYGHPQDAAKQFGRGTTEYALGDPSMSLAQSFVRPFFQSRGKNIAGDEARNAFNTTAGFAGPIANAVFVGATGHAPYLTKSGDFEGIGPVRLGRSAGLMDRAAEIGRESNPISTVMIPSEGYGRSRMSAVLPFLKEESLSDRGTALARLHDFQESKYQEIAHEADPAQRRALAEDALQQAREFRSDEGARPTTKELLQMRHALTNAVRRYGSDRSSRYMK